MKQKIIQLKKTLETKANFWASKIFVSFLRPLSRISRRIFGFRKIREALGLLVLMAVISLIVLPPTLASAQTSVEVNRTQVEIGSTVVIETNESLRLPLDDFSLTQGYSFLHPGLDFATIKGTPVYAMAEGTVETVKYDLWAFGNHVIIDHGRGRKTLSAHLAKIEVKEGEKVTTESIIGLVGSTGWATGPHLHFQIWQDNKLVNPRSFFEAYLGHRLASTR